VTLSTNWPHSPAAGSESAIYLNRKVAPFEAINYSRAEIASLHRRRAKHALANAKCAYLDQQLEEPFIWKSSGPGIIREICNGI